LFPIVPSLGLPCLCSAVLLLVLKPMTEGVATFSEHIFPAFQELFSIDPIRHIRAGAPNKRSVNPQLSNLRMPRCTSRVLKW
jgi:hypothetical protein